MNDKVKKGLTNAGEGLLGGLIPGFNSYTAIDASPLNSQLNNASTFQFSAADNNNLAYQWDSYDPLKTNYNIGDVGFDWGEQASNTLNSALSGLATGGVWGAVGGAVAGLAGNVAGYFKADNEIRKAEERAKRINLANQNKFNTTLNSIERNNDMINKRNAILAAFGGPLESPEGFTFINSGGTHESNPYGGVPAGISSDGSQNLVEEGEVVYKDYVFSNRIKVPKRLRTKYKINKDNITFADALKQLLKKHEETMSDPITKRGVESIVNDFTTVQEELRAKKQSKQSINNTNVFDEGGKRAVIRRKSDGKTFELPISIGDDGYPHLSGRHETEILKNAGLFANDGFPVSDTYELLEGDASIYNMFNALLGSEAIVENKIGEPYDPKSVLYFNKYAQWGMNRSSVKNGFITYDEYEALKREKEARNNNTTKLSEEFDFSEFTDEDPIPELFDVNVGQQTTKQQVQPTDENTSITKNVSANAETYLENAAKEALNKKVKALPEEFDFNAFNNDSENPFLFKIEKPVFPLERFTEEQKAELEKARIAAETALSKELPTEFDFREFTDNDLTPELFEITEGDILNGMLGKKSDKSIDAQNISPYGNGITREEEQRINEEILAGRLQEVGFKPTEQSAGEVTATNPVTTTTDEGAGAVEKSGTTTNPVTTTAGEQVNNVDPTGKVEPKTISIGKPYLDRSNLENELKRRAIMAIGKRELNKTFSTIPTEFDFSEFEEPEEPVLFAINNSDNRNLKYVPLIANAAGLLSNVFTKPDSSYIDKIENATKRPAPVSPTLLTNRYTPRLVDTNYLVNKGKAQAAATRNALLNTANSAGAARANLLAQDYNTQGALADTYLRGLEANEAKRLEAARFNLGIDQYNSNALMQAAQYNTQQDQNYNQRYVQGLNQAAALKNSLEQARANAIGTNLGALADNAYQLYRDDIIDSQINFYNSFAPYLNEEGKALLEQYRKNGGKLNRKKRKGLTY